MIRINGKPMGGDKTNGRGALEFLRLEALEAHQGSKESPVRVYAALVDGKQLHRFATVSRVRRGDARKILGYQRQRVRSHIAEIREYLESQQPMIPNAICVAFNEQVKFEPPQNSGTSRYGKLVIPIDDTWSEADKPGLVVDGQQRCAAIHDANVESFEIFMVAFITSNDTEQREQFIRVNSTKPLPRSLIHELLPATKTKLSRSLQRRRFPAKVLEHLNYDSSSPLQGMIQTHTNAQGVIKDTSILSMVESSLSDGALYRFRDPLTGDGALEPILAILNNYWTAVRDVFDHAWGLPPRRSRLMHGVGITSMGALMDTISAAHYWADGIEILDCGVFRDDLHEMNEKDVFRWTSGSWDFSSDHKRRWSELQNTGKDIRLLTDYLRVKYNAEVWDKRRQKGVR
jgi:DGQHR domain-containing protein